MVSFLKFSKFFIVLASVVVIAIWIKTIGTFFNVLWKNAKHLLPLWSLRFNSDKLLILCTDSPVVDVVVVVVVVVIFIIVVIAVIIVIVTVVVFFVVVAVLVINTVIIK